MAALELFKNMGVLRLEVLDLSVSRHCIDLYTDTSVEPSISDLILRTT